MTWMYRMHGVPVPVPGDINQMPRKFQPNGSVLPNQMSATTDQTVRVQPKATSTRTILLKIFDQCSFCISKSSLIGSLLLRCRGFFGCLRLSCRRATLGLGLSFTRRPECLTKV